MKIIPVIPQDMPMPRIFVTTQEKLAALRNITPRKFFFIKSRNDASKHLLKSLEKITGIKLVTWTSPSCRSALDRELKEFFRREIEFEMDYFNFMACEFSRIRAFRKWSKDTNINAEEVALPKRAYITSYRKLCTMANINQDQLHTAFRNATKEQASLLEDLTGIHRVIWTGSYSWSAFEDLRTFLRKEREMEIQFLNLIGRYNFPPEYN